MLKPREEILSRNDRLCQRNLRPMTEPALSIASTLPSRPDQTFPTLTPAQAARVAAHGIARPVRPGEVLIEAGDRSVPLFLVTAGRIEIVRSSGTAEALVVAHG